MNMNSKGIENVNPQRFSKQSEREITPEEEDESVVDPIDEREVFGTMLRYYTVTQFTFSPKI